YNDDLYRIDEDDVEVMNLSHKINVESGVPWQHRFGTKNTAFVEAMLYHDSLYKPAIERLEKDHVVFTDGSTFECDTIICCTGFKPTFPFLEKFDPDLAVQVSNPRTLFKRIFHPRYKAGLGWIGFERPAIGNISLCSELQARYFALVVSGEQDLPPTETMLEVIEHDAHLDRTQYPVDSRRLGALTDFLPFIDNMARLIGCHPPLTRLFWT